jgi:hypothetical protein
MYSQPSFILISFILTSRHRLSAQILIRLPS